MRTLTTEQFNNALAFLKNRHTVVLSRTAQGSEPRVSVDGQTLQRADVIRMAETEGGATAGSPAARTSSRTVSSRRLARTQGVSSRHSPLLPRIIIK